MPGTPVPDASLEGRLTTAVFTDIRSRSQPVIPDWRRQTGSHSQIANGMIEHLRMVVIVMGVAGSGKTTIGRLLAQDLGWSFYDADSFHPPENVRKMASGTPLTDKDRQPWLEALRELIDGLAEQKQDAVLACSALKKSYREKFGAGAAHVEWVYLKADRDLIHARLADRRDHYMPAALVESQFAALEEPAEAITVAADNRPAEIVARLRSELGI